MHNSLWKMWQQRQWLEWSSELTWPFCFPHGDVLGYGLRYTPLVACSPSLFSSCALSVVSILGEMQRYTSFAACNPGLFSFAISSEVYALCGMRPQSSLILHSTSATTRVCALCGMRPWLVDRRFDFGRHAERCAIWKMCNSVQAAPSRHILVPTLPNILI